MKNTLVIDLDRCSGCDSCVAACKMENQMNLGVVRNHVSAVGPVGTFPDIEMYWLPMQCQQCENPGCIEVCPTGASYRDEETGIVLVNAEDCIGCESCLTADSVLCRISIGGALYHYILRDCPKKEGVSSRAVPFAPFLASFLTCRPIPAVFRRDGAHAFGR